MEYHKQRMLEQKQREEWVKGLKVGDEVALRGDRYSYYSWYIRKIVKITPTGRLNLEKGYVVMPNGVIRGTHSTHIHPVTEEIRTFIWREWARGRISKELKVNELSDNNLNRILQVMKEHEGEKNSEKN